ncbi:MAG: hypothetical protein ACREIA_11750, partial [Opitutaceae bacterium]
MAAAHPAFVDIPSMHPLQGVRVYRASPRIRAALLGVWGCAAGGGGVLWWIGWRSADADMQLAGLVVAAIVSAIMLPIFWLAAWHYPRLVLDAKGIVLRQLGWRLETTWDNVESLVRKGGAGLLLKRPLSC